MNTYLKISACFGIFLLINACSLDAKKGPSLLLRFDPQSEARESLAPMKWFSEAPVIRVAPDMSQFQCIGVNVTGPGIADSSMNDPDTAAESQAVYQKLLTGNSCSYRGVVGGITRPSAAGTYSPIDVALSIPAGPGRMIQVFGVGNLSGPNPNADVKVQSMCNTSLQDVDQGTGSSKVIYELARAHIPSLFSSRSMTLNSNLSDTTAWTDPRTKLLDCGNNSCKEASKFSFDGLLSSSALDNMNIKKVGIRFEKKVSGKFNIVATVKLASQGSQEGVLNFKIYSGITDFPSGNALVSKDAVPVLADGEPHDVTITIPDFSEAPGFYWLVMEGTSEAVGFYYAEVAADLLNYAYTFNGTSWYGFDPGIPIHNINLCGPN